MIPVTDVSRRANAATGRRRPTRNVTENGEQDVDEEISIAASLEEDAHRWQENGEDDLDDVAVRRDELVSRGKAIARRGEGGSAYLPVKGIVSVCRNED